ncbi:MAG TPA: sigma-54 dependent transcriptional regulator [Terriglobales bacterium]|nr:sigma-54 dependent transcriptional regulator [Terriglobales bacterium]
MSSLLISPPAPAASNAAVLGASEALGLLIVSSNEELRRELVARLQSDHWTLAEGASGAEALEKIDAGTVSMVLMDPNLPDLKVDEFKAIVQAQYPYVTVIPVNPHTGQPILATPSPDSLCFEIARRIERGTPFRMGNTLTAGAVGESDSIPGSLPGFIGMAPPVQRLCSIVRLVAPRDTTVLITGESGTGKDVVARAVHQLSTRRLKPFVVINCAAIPEALLEAELFGFVKGAFTGAVQSKIGRIHAAQGGTLFLDEIGDLPLGLQSKLLRFLEQGEVQRLGSTDTFRVDVRVIGATNANLRRLVREHGFREDLFYRLSIFPVELSPLRERMEDLPLLTQSFLTKFCPHNVTLSPGAVALLHQHTWPGNVRELRNVIERASILVGQEREIRPEHIII